MSNPQSQVFAAFRYRSIVSAVLFVLLALLIFAARSHREEAKGLGAYSAVQVSQTSAAEVITADRLAQGG